MYIVIDETWISNSSICGIIDSSDEDTPVAGSSSTVRTVQPSTVHTNAQNKDDVGTSITVEKDHTVMQNSDTFSTNYHGTGSHDSNLLVQNIQGGFNKEEKSELYDDVSDVESDYVDNIDSISYIANDVEKIDELNFDDSDISIVDEDYDTYN